MTLFDRIKQAGTFRAATATAATDATEMGEVDRTVAPVAAVAVAATGTPVLPPSSSEGDAEDGISGCSAIATFEQKDASYFTVSDSMTIEQETRIRQWLAYIEETDEIIITEVISLCRNNPKERNQILAWASEIPTRDRIQDERRFCVECKNFSSWGDCLATKRGETAVSRTYVPIRDLPMRCGGYLPKPDDPDQRPGSQRWPRLDDPMGRLKGRVE